MNEIAFATKRAYQGFLRLTRERFAAAGLTAARFDMLLVIRGSVRRRSGPLLGAIMQEELPVALGVSKSVVSRMLRALEQRGLVERFILEEDQRCRIVQMTDQGEAAFLAARDLLMRCVQRVVVTAVCFGQRPGAKEQRARVRHLVAYLAALRVYFGDRAPLEYDFAGPPPYLREWGTPAIMLRDWTPSAAPHGFARSAPRAQPSAFAAA
jgi:DNA-binding MarR family transcriptional regulator